MKCGKCGERVLRRSRIPEEGFVVLNKFVLIRKGSLIAACPRCGNKVELLKSKPTIIKVSK